MNHQKVYDSIIEKARNLNRQKLNKSDVNYFYYENHHIIPKCMNGSDDKENLVLLTAREHFICHKLLTYIYQKNRKIICAFHFLTFGKNKKICSSRDYKYAIELQKLTPVSQETREKISKANKGKKFSQEHINKIVESGKISKSTAEYKEKFRLSVSGIKNGMFGKTGILNPMYGKHLSEEQKEYLSSLYKGKSFLELYGEEKANEIKSHINNKGEHNPFFNKHHTSETKQQLQIQKRKYNISLDIIEKIKEEAKCAPVKHLVIKYDFNDALIRRIIAGEYNKGYYEAKSK